jgi:putative heme transporter
MRRAAGDALRREGQGAPDAHEPDGAMPSERMPGGVFTRRRVLAFAAFVVSAVAFLYFVLPRITGSHGLKDSWNRIDKGEPGWLAGAFALEVCAFLGYQTLFRAVCVRGESRIEWKESYQINMAALAATRLFAAAGAGGVALTAWALRRSGMEARVVACRMVAFVVLLYGVYMGTLIVDGLGLYYHLWPGGGGFAITVLPAIFAAGVILIVSAMALVPSDFDRRLVHWAHGRGFVGRMARRLAAAPASAASGVRTAIALVRSRDPKLLGAVAWWGFDIAVLWACFHAFGEHPDKGVIVMAYFVGMLGNVLPLPGGIGGVDGGMIGAFAAFGVPIDSAVVAVLAYRGFSFWLPTLPGAVAYFQLRRTVARWEAEPSPA